MAQVRIAVNGGTTNIQPDEWCMKRFEEFLLFGETVMNEQFILHIISFDKTKVR